MAGGQERVLRRRIKSVQSTKKITKAMELIAASRIVKAQQRVAAARPYSEQITEVIRNLAAAGAGGDSPLLEPAREIDHGRLRRGRRRPRPGRWLQLVGHPHRRAGACSPTGPRAARPRSSPSARRRTATSASAATRSPSRFAGFSDDPSYEDARGVADATSPSASSRASTTEVHIAYTQFLSMGTQRVADVVHVHAARRRPLIEAPTPPGPTADYEFEPSPDEILERLLPRYAEARLYAALLDAAASSTPPASGP